MKNRILLSAVIAALLSLPLALSAADKKGGFASMDKNGDGKLDKKEFSAAQKDPSKAEKRFAQLDTDGDGFVTQKEMAAGQKKKKN